MNTAWRASASGPTAPAYTPVHARRTLARSASSTASTTSTTTTTMTAAPASSTETRKRVEWPPAVREYVQRCFVPEQQIPGISRAEMEARLKQVITGAAETNSLEAIDWASLPLPQQMIQAERNAALPSVTHQLSLHPTRTSPKRKSTDISTDTSTSTGTSNQEIPPWRATAEDKRRRLENAATTTNNNNNISNSDGLNSKSNSNISSHHHLESRKRRFESTYSPAKVKSPQPSYTQTYTSQSSNQHAGPIVGRSTQLEKRYLRLTAAPNPDNVRPLPVLRKTLDLLKRRWKQENNYGYICDQFKSMRQDLTVQHIKNDFTVLVYEIHARIALEKGDLGEYNQCQTQLQGLYALNLGGGHPMEFKAYRILYFIYTRNQTAINSALSDLTAAEKADPAVSHALAVRAALAMGNYHRFFQLYLDTPNMGAYLMDMFVDRERLAALACICKAYKPDVNIRFITEELGFESDEQSARFVLDHVSEQLLQETQDGVRLLTGKCGAAFEAAKQEAFRRIDIKGQI
ncbi:hypothetical protein H112_03025 [Trichophyton rubrum D6]|uniref:SAC3/GANP/THP3 conserved domain-containing protein n=4 Tax=Trichophyton rubrum TaxID=5551 RepID=F2ST44_TRIRC|nr:uncharacterized protein TERG_05646 [Trichophyton rubrum CBS 118892]EZF24418.1 hypothetical protein H100_03030 [Trichophyton rubrum MR850]EZF43454.1 hypothetical protein H102_03023 [Trichophyton rubrum CBS 100081]EZF54097.1 hypothetical protein H103_03038 [Trichophyton rubrum CBS 288.86]EZF64715.1 hypothetical protein H104_03018 [Trichophyton rubrum CBS 289.86]EZF86077.1 hypothetical protein H110_03031 [Trichophyton rubrum MR1448]EZF96809.1 hypothetical protein H113_03039 [Trichophyton rubr